MTRLSLLAAGALVLISPQIAWAGCEARLAKAANAVGLMPAEVDYRVNDQLNEYYSEAEALVGSDEAACLALVVRMEDLIRRNGGRIADEAPPSGRASAGVGAQAEPSPAAGVISVSSPTPFSQTLPSRLASVPAQQRAEVAALSDYINTARGLGMRVIQQATTSAPTDANVIIRAANEAIEAAEGAQQVLINERGDQLHAELEDAFRSFEEARDSLQNRINQSGSATAAERANLRRATGQLASVRARLNRWLLDRLGEGRAPGYAAAFLALEARQQQEERTLTAQCDARFEAAHAQLAQNYLGGDRHSNALDQAIAACQSISIPVRKRHQSEMDELEAHFAITDGGQPSRSRRPRAQAEEDYLAPLVRRDEDYIAPLVRNDSGSDDDYIAPLVREDGRSPEDYIAPLVRDDALPPEDYIAPLVRPAAEAGDPGARAS